MMPFPASDVLKAPSMKNDDLSTGANKASVWHTLGKRRLYIILIIARKAVTDLIILFTLNYDKKIAL
jgi:hypothetical protein